MLKAVWIVLGLVCSSVLGAQTPLRVPSALIVDSYPVGTGTDVLSLSLQAHHTEDKTAVRIGSVSTDPVNKISKVIIHAGTTDLKTCLPPAGQPSADTIICAELWPRASMRSGLNEIVLWVMLGNAQVVRGTIARIARP